MWVRSLIFDVPLYHNPVLADLKDHVAQLDLVDRLRHDACLSVDHVERGTPKRTTDGMCYNSENDYKRRRELT